MSKFTFTLDDCEKPCRVCGAILEHVPLRPYFHRMVCSTCHTEWVVGKEYELHKFKRLDEFGGIR